MKAVILLAGASTRTFPLTVTRPKPLLPVAGKPIIAHTLDSVSDSVDEILLVVHYKREMIEAFVGSEWNGTPVKYIDQPEPLGTGHAFSLAQEHVDSTFLAVLGDNLYCKEDFQHCLKHDASILATEVENPSEFGVITAENSVMKSIVEKPKQFISNLAVAGAYVLPHTIFELLNNLPKTERGEFELPDALRELSKNQDIHVVNATTHHFIGYPWDVLRADQELRNRENVIGENSTISGKVENSSIGKHCTIKGTVRNSIILDNSIIEEHSIVDNSFIGSNVVFAGTAEVAATTSMVKGKELSAGVFGCAIGDDVQAKDTLIKPGCKVWPSKTIQGTITEDKQ